MGWIAMAGLELLPGFEQHPPDCGADERQHLMRSIDRSNTVTLGPPASNPRLLNHSPVPLIPSSS